MMTNLPPRSKVDSHKHNHVSLFHYQINTNSTHINISLDVNGGPSINNVISKNYIFIHNRRKCVKALTNVVFDRLKNIFPNQKLNVVFCKIKQITIVKWKSYQQKQVLVFLFHVMLVGGWTSKVVFMSLTNFDILWQLESKC